MKAKQLFDRLIENWPVKAFCFAAALLLYVFYQNQSLDKKVFSVPLNLVTNNGFVAVEHHPATVSVSIKGKPDELAQVREKDISACLDLSYVSEEGKFDFPVILTLSDSVSHLNPLEMKVSPESVSLAVEEEFSAFVDIFPLLKGKPGYGYELKSATVSPNQVKITGPRSMVMNCKGVQTLPVDIGGATKSFVHKSGVEQKGVSFKAENVSLAVKIDISETKVSKKFDNLPVNLTNIDPGLEVKLMTKNISVVMEGALVDLEHFRPSSYMVLADCSGIHEPGNYEVKLSYILPSNFSLAEGNIKTVPVSFVVRKVEEEKIAVTEAPNGVLEEKVVDIPAFSGGAVQ